MTSTLERADRKIPFTMRFATPCRDIETVEGNYDDDTQQWSQPMMAGSTSTKNYRTNLGWGKFANDTKPDKD